MIKQTLCCRVILLVAKLLVDKVVLRLADNVVGLMRLNLYFSLKANNYMGGNVIFNERKAAEVAAFFLFKAEGEIPLIKLIKLMYLAERLFLGRYGEPLTGDRLVSMPHGPVLSITYDLAKGAMKPTMDNGWESWVSDRAEHMVALRDRSRIITPEDDLLSLSDSDIEVLDEVWENFGHMDKWALVEYTHNGGCPEWKDPEGSSLPITYGSLFKEFGYTEEQTTEIEARIKSQARLQSAFVY